MPPIEDVPEQVISLVQSHPNASWFHLAALQDRCPLSPGFSPVVLYLQNQDDDRISGVICGFLIGNTRNSLPDKPYARIRVYGSPLISEESEDHDKILNLLLKGLSDFAQLKTSCIEFWNDQQTASWKSAFSAQGFLYSAHLNLIKTIPDKLSALKSLSPSRRRQIRIASELGSIIREAESIEEVTQLYQILKQLFTHKVRKEIPNLETFLNFFSTSKTALKGVILVVLVDNMVIGGIICPVLPDKTIYEWYICGLDKEYPKNYPSVMATWAGLAYAADNKIPTFNFLGLGKPETPYGVRDFKLRFGGEVVNYGRYIKLI